MKVSRRALMGDAAMNSPQAGAQKAGNPNPENEKLINESLIAECRDMGDRIVTLLNSLDRVLGAGLLLIAITATVVAATGNTYFLMLLPFAVSIVLLYHAFINNDIKSMGAYKKVLEEVIADKLGSPVILWESKVVKLGKKFNRIYQNLYFAIFALTLVGSAWIALAQAVTTLRQGHEHAIWYLIGTLLSIGVGYPAVVIGAVRADKNAIETEKAVLTALGRAPKQ